LGAEVHGSHVEDYCGARRGRLTTKCHESRISDKSDEAQMSYREFK